MIIREIKENDADKLLELRNRIERESPFMLQEPEERDTTVEEQKSEINDILSSNNETIKVKEDDHEKPVY